MKRSTLLAAYLAIAAFVAAYTAKPTQAQTPAPAANTTFQLPLADKTTASAVLLPTHDGSAYLVYALPSGQIVSYLITPTTFPTPTPPPPTPPQPEPPQPQPPVPPPGRVTLAIVENPSATTFQQRAILADPAWRKAAEAKTLFRGVIPADVKEAKTGVAPPALAPFLERASHHNLPWVMLTADDGSIIWEGQLPPSPAELTSVIIAHTR